VAISVSDSGGSSVTADINVTPMIDIMLVLLIIFMIVTPLISTGFTATMPAGTNVETSEEQDDEMVLGVDDQGGYFLNGTPGDPANIEAQLKAYYGGRTEDKLLYFKADVNLPYATIQKAVEMGRRAGARQLVAIVDQRGGLGGGSGED
jgi:biopolymer transport protein TolR